MASWKFASLSAVTCYMLVMAAAEPQCEDVEDFRSCTGDTTDFCPTDIPCVCRDRKPYCSCPYYRGPKGDNWYMGEKCDQLWNTFDLIFVTVLPAVSLAFVVGVVAQLIHYCKTKPTRKAQKPRNRQREQVTSNSHHNRGYVREGDQCQPNLPLVNISLEKLQQMPGFPQNAVFPVIPSEQKFQYTPPENYPINTPYFQSVSNLGNAGLTLPHQGHSMTNRQEPQGVNPIPTPQNYDSPALPAPDYGPNAPNTSSTDWSSRPFMFGRPQIRNDFTY